MEYCLAQDVPFVDHPHILIAAVLGNSTVIPQHKYAALWDRLGKFQKLEGTEGYTGDAVLQAKLRFVHHLAVHQHSAGIVVKVHSLPFRGDHTLDDGILQHIDNHHHIALFHTV